MSNLANANPKTVTLARLGLGLAFFVFGLNGFLDFIPQPPPPPAAGAFLGGLAGAGYFFPLLKGTEVLAGLALLSNRWVPLALAVLAPVVLNILAFHAFLAPAGIVLSLAILAVELFLAWSYRAAFAPILAAKVAPPAVAEHAPVPAE